MKKLLLPLLFIFLLFGCSDDQALEVVSIPVINEEPEQQIELPTEVGFPIDGEMKSVTLGTLPMLAFYLSSTENIDVALNKVQGNTIAKVGGNSFILVSYACQGTVDSCSYILMLQGSDGDRSLPVADLATFQEAKLSPDEEVIALIFDRKNELEVIKSHVVAVDVNEMEELTLKNDELKVDILNYNNPIYNMDWKDSKRLQIEVPAIIPEDDPTINTDNEPIENEVVEFEI